MHHLLSAHANCFHSTVSVAILCNDIHYLFYVILIHFYVICKIHRYLYVSVWNGVYVTVL